MPAPLGKTPTRKMPKITVFGLPDSQPTRAAIRFFRERRIVVEFVDLRKKPLAPAELRRLIDRLGPEAILEEAVTPRPDFVAAVRADPRLLRLPLVLHRDAVTAGPSESKWREWLARR